MKRIISNGALAAVAAGALLLSSCSDRDMFNPNYKAEEYAANWESKFGQIDPNQDWSMATKVTAKANIPGVSGESVLRIYTDNPILSASRLLATTILDNGVGSATFDALKGAEQVFVVVSNNGRNAVYGYADIENGNVDAGKTTAKKVRTRSASDVTKGSMTGVVAEYETNQPTGYTYNWQTKTVAEWEAYYKGLDLQTLRYNHQGLILLSQ